MMKITYGGVEVTKYLRPTRGLDRKILPEVDYDMRKVGRSDGYTNRHTSYGKRTIAMPFRITNELIKNRRELARVLSTRDPLPLIFSDEPDKLWYALPSGDISVDEMVFLGHGVIDWIVPDGMAHAVTPRVFTNINLPSGTNNLVLDPEFRDKLKYYKLWSVLKFDTYNGSNILGADLTDVNTIADAGETKLDGLYIIQDLVTGDRSIPSLKVGDKISARVLTRINTAALDDDTGALTAALAVQELDTAGGKVLYTHKVTPSNLSLGAFQTLKLEGITIKDGNTKALRILTALALTSSVDFTQPQLNLSGTLPEFNEPAKNYSDYIAVTNPGTYKAWPIIRATMNGDNGLLGLINQSGDILQFGYDGDLDVVPGVMSDKVINLPMRDDGDAFETGHTVVAYTHVNYDPERPNLPGNGGLDWGQDAENVFPLYDLNTETVWSGPTLYKDIPRNSANKNTGSFLWSNRLHFNSDAEAVGRLEFTLIDDNGEALVSAVLRDSKPNANIRNFDVWVRNRVYKTISLDITKFTGTWFEINIGRNANNVYEFKLSKVDKHTSQGIISSATVTEVLQLPELDGVGIKAMNVWFQKYGERKASRMGWSDCVYTWLNEETVTNIPNLFSDGDLLEIDTLSRTVRVNGVENTQLHALGNKWERFAIEPGTTTIKPVFSAWASNPDITIELRGAYI